MRFRHLVFAFVLFLFNPTSSNAQFREFGLSREGVIKILKKNKKLLLGLKGSKITKYNFVDHFNDPSVIHTNEKFPIVVNIESYGMPYTNLTTEYYFNSNGYCDSIAQTENACLDCIPKVSKDGENIYYLMKWTKQMDGSFKSFKPVLFQLKDQNGKKSKQFAFMKYVRDDLPPDGSCRKNHISIMPFEKNFDERSSNHFVKFSLWKNLH